MFSSRAGTFEERAGIHGCQMPEQLLRRIIRACSNDGEVVLDPFSGSATTLAVAQKLNRQFVECELSKEYVAVGTQRLANISIGDKLDGPPGPKVSAPCSRREAAFCEEEEVQGHLNGHRFQSKHQRKHLLSHAGIIYAVPGH